MVYQNHFGISCQCRSTSRCVVLYPISEYTCRGLGSNKIWFSVLLSHSCTGEKTGKSHLCAKAENWNGKFMLYDITCIFKFLYPQKVCPPLNYFVVWLSDFIKNLLNIMVKLPRYVILSRPNYITFFADPAERFQIKRGKSLILLGLICPFDWNSIWTNSQWPQWSRWPQWLHRACFAQIWQASLPLTILFAIK